MRPNRVVKIPKMSEDSNHINIMYRFWISKNCLTLKIMRNVY